MATLFKWLTRSGLLRGAALLSLVFVSFQSAAADNSASTITLFAPGAVTGARAIVQFQNPAGDWFAVAGWESNLDQKTGGGVLYEQWTVNQEQFGQGPFRWVVSGVDGKTIWAISDIFNLPPGGGMDRSETIRPDNLLSAAQTITVKTALGEAAQVPVLKGSSTVQGETCKDCDPHAHITAYISGLPVNSWIAVQWQDGFGTWQTVQGWQGNAAFLFANGDLKVWTPDGVGSLFQQWSVNPGYYGRGPFRWAVYSGPNGSLLAVSPNFALPTTDGANNIMYLSK